jgi:ATP-dependent HslUV protease ATP-binding subunit HslU
MAKLSQAPFIKVEATKFTEVGFHGKDVDQIIRDLVEISINMTKKRIRDDMKVQAKANVEKIIVEAIIGENSEPDVFEAKAVEYQSNALDEHPIEIEVPPKPVDKSSSAADMMMNPAAIFESLQKASRTDERGPRRSDRRRLTVAEAKVLLEESELDKLVGVDCLYFCNVI